MNTTKRNDGVNDGVDGSGLDHSVDGPTRMKGEIVTDNTFFILEGNFLETVTGPARELLEAVNDPDKFEEMMLKHFPVVELLRTLGSSEVEFYRTKHAMLDCCRFVLGHFEGLMGKGLDEIEGDVKDMLEYFQSMGLEGIMEYGDDGDNESKSNTFSRGLNRMLQHLAVHDITKPGKMVDFLVKQGLSADHDGSLAELVRADFAPLLKVDSNTGKPFATAEMVVILREAVKDEKLKAKLECSLAPHMILNPGAALNAGELSEAAFFHMMRDDKIARAEWLFDFSGGKRMDHDSFSGPMFLSWLPHVLVNYARSFRDFDRNRKEGMDPTDQFRKFMYAEDLFAKAKVDIEKITQGEHGWAIARLLRTDTLHQKEDVASVGDEWVRVFNKIEDPVKGNVSAMLVSEYWDLRYFAFELQALRDAAEESGKENIPVEEIFIRFLEKVTREIQEHQKLDRDSMNEVQAVYWPDRKQSRSIFDSINFSLESANEMVEALQYDISYDKHGVAYISYGDDVQQAMPVLEKRYDFGDTSSENQKFLFTIGGLSDVHKMGEKLGLQHMEALVDVFNSLGQEQVSQLSTLFQDKKDFQKKFGSILKETSFRDMFSGNEKEYYKTFFNIILAISTRKNVESLFDISIHVDESLHGNEGHDIEIKLEDGTDGTLTVSLKKK